MLLDKPRMLAAAATVTASLLLLPATAAAASGYRTVNSTFGDYAIRYKSWAADDTKLCNGGSAHHAGWADMDDRHLFFWYHEARHDPASAPLVIWHQGGPGGSSLHGMLFENGPCLIDGPNATRFNPNSWTEHFNVVYLDQPAGVGFSYVDNRTDGTPPAMPSRTPASSLDSVAFIRLLYEAFPRLASVDLHLSGESFAGRYVPTLAASILEYNSFFDHTPDARGAVIPLRSILVGNPWIDPAVQAPSMHEVSCFDGWRGEYPRHLEEDDCKSLGGALPRCEKLLRACEQGSAASPLCAMAVDACGADYLEVFQKATRSVYDRRRRHCPGPGNCYPDVADPVRYLNSPAVLDGEFEIALRTRGAKTRWEMEDWPTFQRFSASGDYVAPTTAALRALLEYSRDISKKAGGGSRRPLDVLLYVGVTDIICNPDGVLEALRGIEWEGKASFRGTPWAELPWETSSGGRAGRVKSVPGLWLAEVEEAGHMVPYDQPVSSLKLVKHWLDHLDGQDVKGRRPVSEAAAFSQDQSGQSVLEDDRGVEL
ncbi:Putative peptidase S10, serine carboxypeptidase, alpha/Beta hydrolase [Colletotrichum destructivum]|uniref:Peptidase S10, serine carboxypeptidase, alpha/Beta hydrolase n=1 Tax=Colletotrichum destructivum TaxID=34406 RepID=A0AAX4ISA7_9PEZI|nr:Putative peptidase S10, serine carboxypeptidase, alpha/Beta hydrolase [Colletotrichum destructivum]